jgi:heterodisulfide reductase subunit A
MVDVVKHPKVTLLTNSEVTDIRGFVGNYEATILKNPRYVNEQKCVGCALCTKACPVKVPDEFNENMTEKRAISIYSTHAVPNVAVINPDRCLRLRHKKNVCGKCQEACEAKAIDFEQQPETVRVKVGGIILAVGSQVFDAAQVTELGYGRFKNVISNIQFERLSDASGPTGGKILSKNGKSPQTIAFIQCVGSRDKRFHDYCCRVGCMITLKQAILAKEKINEDVKVYVCYMDIRAFGKGYDEFYRRARDMDVEFLAGLPSEIHELPDGSLSFDVYDKGTNRLLQINADLVVLGTGLVPNKDLAAVSAMLHASRSSDGFLLEAHPKLRPLESAVAGVFLAGACQGPKDIPDTVAQASGASAKTLDLLSQGEIELEPLKAVVDEDLCSGCRICASACPFLAIEMKSQPTEGTEKARAEVIEAMCQGCGLCSAACPTGAIKIQQYSNKQVTVQVDAALSETVVEGGK